MKRINYTITCLSPCHHGDFGATGNVRAFRREPIILPDGQIVRVPCVSGNAIRGQIRRLVMREMLAVCGIDRITMPARQWDRLYGALVNGGTLDGSEARVDPDAVRALRGALPSLSVLGAALYSHMMPGRARVGLARLACDETAQSGHAADMGTLPPADDLVTDWSQARLPDPTEQDVEASGVGPMPTTVEVVITGARLVGRIDCGSDAIEASVMARGLSLMEAIGGKSGGGLGQVVVEHDGDGALWLTWLTQYREQVRETLIALAERIGGSTKAKKGKAAPTEAAA